METNLKNVWIASTFNQTTTTYGYDGFGRRVTKTSNGQTTTYVYDPFGNLAQEYGVTPLTSTLYPVTDALGSTRVVADSNGAAVRCYDYLPFGEELPAGAAGRTAPCFGNATYPTASADTVNQKFTGKERDAETGLDYFGARYMSAAQGRFTAVDPSMESVVLQNPQSWNRYSYTINNPLRYIDPNGELWITSSDANNPYAWVDECEEGQKCYKSVAAAIGKQLRVYGANNASDITNYSGNKSGMIDLRELASNSSAAFSVASTDQRFLSVNAARDVFLAARDFNEATGSNIFITSAALATGRQRGHTEHASGFEGVDFRYVGFAGKSIQHDLAALLAAPYASATVSAFDAFEAYGFARQISAVPAFFGTHHSNDSKQSLRNQHLNHAHVSRRVAPPRR